MRRVFIDTNVFIYAFEYPNSNSAVILGLLNRGEIEAVVSERVVHEVVRYFERHHSIALARLFRRYLHEVCVIVSRQNVLDAMEAYRRSINEKDLEQLAVTKKLRIPHLISYDRDFLGVNEYITPRAFALLMKRRAAETEF